MQTKDPLTISCLRFGGGSPDLGAGEVTATISLPRGGKQSLDRIGRMSEEEALVFSASHSEPTFKDRES